MEILHVTIFVLTAVNVAVCRPYHNPNCKPDRDVIVHLFDWTWSSIKKECVEFLGPKGFCGVQVSPPAEHAIITKPNRPWWERYQPVSYKIISRSGNEQEFRDMVSTCNSHGVSYKSHDRTIYRNRNWGRPFQRKQLQFPGVPYTAADCNGSDNCPTDDGDIHDYSDPIEARNCALFGLSDLRLAEEYVRHKIAGYLNKLVDMGVAGFRIDAAKHMWPGDLENIFPRLHDLPMSSFPQGSKPFVYQEIIDLGGEPIKMAEYFNTGRVTNFIYGNRLADVFLRHTNLTQWLQFFDTEVGSQSSDDAVVFIYNHDTERGSLRPFQPITFFEPKQVKIATAFMLAYPYGVPRIMSSFSWTRNIVDGDDKNNWLGPPHNTDMSIKEVEIFPNNTCADRWVCEHRWRQVYNMVGFRKTVQGTPVENWQNPGDFQFAFSRGNKGFIAIVGDDSGLNMNLQTGLPAGTYCDVITGELSADGVCTGKSVLVGSDGQANISIVANSEDPIMAIHINAKLK